MPDLTYPIVLLIVGAGLIVVLWRSGAFTPRSVRAWTLIGSHHHLTDDRPLDERLADRMPSLANVFRETSVPRLLTIAQRRESLNTWLVKVTIYVIVVAVVLLGVDFWIQLRTHRLLFPPLVALLIAGLFVPLFYLSLREEARRRQAAINRAISQSLTEMAILTYSGQYTVSSALEFVARCHQDGALLGVLTGDTWQKMSSPSEESKLMLSLRPDQLLSTVTIYQRIGREFDVDMFNELATNMRRIAEKGLVPSDVLTSLSAAGGKKQLAEMNVKSEQAKPRMALCIGLMVMPLLSLILYPASVAIVTAFQ